MSKKLHLPDFEHSPARDSSLLYFDKTKAIEDGDSSAQSTIASKKKELRDAPAASAITNADTITKLKAAWNTSLLGTSPYA